ncbi:unnamed protein product, partial [Porites lobata]
MKQWIHAIRRDVGPYFSVNEGTRVCSRHFKTEDLRKSLNGRVSPKPGAVPSIFAWKRSSPRKRAPPTPRFTATSVAKNLTSEASEATDLAAESREIATSTNMVADLAFPETAEMQNTTHFAEKSEKDFLIADLEDKLSAAVAKNEELQELVSKLKEKVTDLEEKYEKLEERLFSFKNIASQDSLVAFYTAFPNLQTMMALYHYLDPGDRGENISYWLSGKDPTVSRIFISWINFLYFKLGNINIWPSREIVNETMPEDFKAKYPTTRVIIDCTEVRCEMPSSLLLNSELFSSYKHHTTLKALVGISPRGFFTFIGQLYSGSISDREMVERSGFLSLPFSKGDTVMADKGFTIEDILPLGVSLNIPPFLGMSDQMSAEDVIATQEIASLRIHVERAINKVKNFL